MSTIALPRLPDGRTYITRQMLLDDEDVRAFYERTKNSWHDDPAADIVVMYPSIDRRERTVETK